MFRLVYTHFCNSSSSAIVVWKSKNKIISTNWKQQILYNWLIDTTMDWHTPFHFYCHISHLHFAHLSYLLFNLLPHHLQVYTHFLLYSFSPHCLSNHLTVYHQSNAIPRQCMLYHLGLGVGLTGVCKLCHSQDTSRNSFSVLKCGWLRGTVWRGPLWFS